MGEDVGRGTLREEAVGAASRGGWDDGAAAELRGAVYRADGRAVVGALRGRPLHDVLQMAGDGLLAALAQETPKARELAARFVRLLRERLNEGDEELADQLEAALGRRPTPMLRPVPVDLNELSSMLEGDPTRGGGRIDLQTGETWPSGTEDVWGEELVDDENLDENRWLWVECLGSRDGYTDMVDFIATVPDQRRREMLEVALSADSRTFWLAGPGSSTVGTSSPRREAVVAHGVAGRPGVSSGHRRATIGLLIFPAASSWRARGSLTRVYVLTRQFRPFCCGQRTAPAGRIHDATATPRPAG